MRSQPAGLIEEDRLLAILRALSLTDCDQRTLAIVAQAAGLADWWWPAAADQAWLLAAGDPARPGAPDPEEKNYNGH